MLTTWLTRIVLATGLLAGCARALQAQDDAVLAPDASPVTAEEAPARERGASAESPLAAGQRQVAERFHELEKLLLRMAELTAPSDPRRAALLRRAVAESKKRDIDHQFDQLIELLQQERLSLVVKSQGELRDDLGKLLELLLSEDRTKRIESEKERIREYLKRVNKIIKEQKGIQGETARDGDAHKLADRQGDLADKTGEIAKQIEQDTGKRPEKNADDKPEKGDSQHGDKPDGERPDGKPEPEKRDSQNPAPPADNDKPKTEKDAPSAGKDSPDKQDKADDEKDKNKIEKKATEGKDQDPQGGKPDGDRPKPGFKDSNQQKPGEPQPGSPADPPPPDNNAQGEAAPGESPPPNDNPAQKRLEQAERRMKEAQQKLEQANRADAKQEQAEAIKELEQAKADLEEILRQLREEEMSRTLAMLESRLRKMLDEQVAVYEGTKRVDKVPQAERDRDDEIEAGRLSRKQAQIAVEADKALAVLREEGSAVAFPEAVGEMRDDMEQVVGRLAQALVGEMTQGIEKDIITALEEMIASLEKAQKNLDAKNKQNQQQPPGEGDDEMPLVDTISELKMIRALQMRVNLRTQRYAELTKTEQTDKPDLLESLKRLAEREQRIHKVTATLS